MGENRISKLAFFLIALWFVYEVYAHFSGNILAWDVYGAYLHLPANFIYNDPFLTDSEWIDALNSKYNSTPFYYQFWMSETGSQVIKYPLGFSIIYAPFFFISHWIAPMFGFEQDGFSMPYQIGITVGHCFYILLGIWLARQILLRFFEDSITTILMLILFAGTNFFFISSVLIAMPHGHLFLFYPLVLFCSMRLHHNPNYQNSVLLGLTIGLASLIRATDSLMIIIPILYKVTNRQSFKEKKTWLKQHYKSAIAVCAVIFSLGSIQLVYYKLATGHFFVDAYNNAGEGFDFFAPYTYDFLFSARAGWLAYSPIFILSFYGLWLMFSKRNAWSIAFVVFTLVNIYVLSSWTCWWYAGSFGQRAMVQSYIIYLIPLGFVVKHFYEKGIAYKVAMSTVLFLLIALNQFQTWQVHQGLIHNFRMTSDAYWAHFLKTESVPNFNELLLTDKGIPAAQTLASKADQLKVSKEFKFAFDGNNWVEKNNLDSLNLNGVFISDDNEFGEYIALPYSKLTQEKTVIFKIEAWIYCIGDKSEIAPILVFKMHHAGKPYYDQYLHIASLEHVRANTWSKVEFVFYSADVRNMKRDEIQIFGWKSGRGQFKMDQIKLSVYEGLR